MRRWRFIFLLLPVIGFACQIGNAFVWYGTPTLELEVIRAKTILRGRVTQINPEQSRDGYELLRFRISEVIKGNCSAQNEIIVTNPFWSTRKNAWKKGDSDAILFLTGEERGIPQINYLLSMKEPDERVIYCSDFSRLSDPDEILQTIRTAAKMKVIEYDNGFSAFDGKSRILVPHNEILLQSARNWVSSSKPQLRWSGAEALAFFDTPDIPARLRPLMGDRYFQFEGQSLWLQKVYPVRQAASTWYINRVLPLPPTVLAEPVFRRIGYGELFLTILLLLLLIALAIMVPRAIGIFLRQDAPHSLPPAFILAAILSIFSVFAWLRTWHTIDEFAFTAERTRQIALFRGQLLYVRIDPNCQPDGILHSSYDTHSGLQDRWDFVSSATPVFRWLPGVRRDAGTFAPATSGITYDYRLLTIPLWPLVLLVVVPTVMPIARVTRRNRRLRLGLCLHCGFDLRATPDRCPECGCVPTT
jgi:hypothetical protein